MVKVNIADVENSMSRLNSHPIYSSLRGLSDLRTFMEHHDYSVWDFMSLAKSIQKTIAPTSLPWMPRGDGSLCRFVNELILETRDLDLSLSLIRRELSILFGE